MVFQRLRRNGSYLAKNGELFDYGMRIYYECNIEELTALLLNLTRQRFIVPRIKRIQQLVFSKEKIQMNSPCLDLRSLSAPVRKLVMKQISEAKEISTKTIKIVLTISLTDWARQQLATTFSNLGALLSKQSK